MSYENMRITMAMYKVWGIVYDSVPIIYSARAYLCLSKKKLKSDSIITKISD